MASPEDGKISAELPPEIAEANRRCAVLAAALIGAGVEVAPELGVNTFEITGRVGGVPFSAYVDIRIGGKE